MKTRFLPLRAAEAEGAGGGEGGDAAAASAAAAAAAGGAQPKWFEDARFTTIRPWIDARGYAVDDPLEAIDKIARGHNNAEKLIGKGVDKLIEKPAEGAPIAEWMRANAAMLGLPESAEKYEIVKPELPKGVEWDATLEAEARKIAFEHGVPPAALNALIGAYGARVGGILGDADAQYQAANAEMMTALEADWGQAAPAKIAAARAAAEAIGAKAGLDGEAIGGVAQALKLKVGDAAVIRMFAAIGELMGEDSLKGAGQGGGFGQTPADAREKLAAMDAEGGEWWKASKDGNMARMKELRPVRDALLRIAAGG